MPQHRAARILVTGAGGFIGKVIVDRLRHAGHETRAGVRRRPPAQAGCLIADLDRPETLAAALRDVDLVVHAAYGDVVRMADQCGALLAAMTHAAACRLVLLSSVAVYGNLEGPIDEHATLPPPIDGYAAGKLACETMVGHWTEQAGNRAIILRPGIVYGKNSPFWIDRMVERIRLGGWGTFGAAGEGIAALIHVDDLAAMCLSAVQELEGESGQSISMLNAIGPETPSWNDYFSSLAAAIGAPPLQPIAAPALRWRQALAVPAKVWRKLGMPGMAAAASAPMPGEVALFMRKARYDMAAARQVLGFEPQVGLAEGLGRSL
ncbi:MAG TPA: NAD(P)-dependent oxidoreductase [Beijerinckiaceae bacterium]|mgnify:CR=1 FL=1|nr:NAD(P)-dependent oxidoreductase [Beijerinckiaceae bacterium]